jgi:RimJ/RimL family protein N-acetyltransferase
LVQTVNPEMVVSMCKMKLKIRTPTVEEAKAIAQVHMKSGQATYHNILPDSYFRNLSLEKRTESWMNRIINKDWRIFVSELNSKITGCAWFGPCRETDFDSLTTWELYSIYILPDEWGKGHGTALLKEAVNQARSLSINSLYLWVFKNNFRSRRFYANRGMIFDSKRVKLTEWEGISVPEVRYFVRLQ